jgi:hypothetical protein
MHLFYAIKFMIWYERNIVFYAKDYRKFVGDLVRIHEKIIMCCLVRFFLRFYHITISLYGCNTVNRGGFAQGGVTLYRV